MFIHTHTQTHTHTHAYTHTHLTVHIPSCTPHTSGQVEEAVHTYKALTLFLN